MMMKTNKGENKMKKHKMKTMMMVMRGKRMSMKRKNKLRWKALKAIRGEEFVSIGAQD